MALAIAKPGKAQLDWKVCWTPADPFFFSRREGGGVGVNRMYILKELK